jgi:hypothetical protein
LNITNKKKAGLAVGWCASNNPTYILNFQKKEKEVTRETSLLGRGSNPQLIGRIRTNISYVKVTKEGLEPIFGRRSGRDPNRSRLESDLFHCDLKLNLVPAGSSEKLR